jgi:hypothetical protein
MEPTPRTLDSWKRRVNRKYDHDAIAVDILAGMTYGQITKKHGCWESTVSNVKKKLRMEMRTIPPFEPDRVIPFLRDFARTLHRYSSVELAKASGYNRTTISKIIRGQTFPSFFCVIDLANAMGYEARLTLEPLDETSNEQERETTGRQIPNDGAAAEEQLRTHL